MPTHRYSCCDRMCGADDCFNCHPSRVGADAPDSEAPLTRRMLATGYEWDGECWVSVLRHVTRTARRAHHGIAVGQRYVEVTTISVDAGGRSLRSRSYRRLGVEEVAP